MELRDLYARITDEYAAKILRWAVKKTGSRFDGEELSQEVLLQVFIAVSRQDHIEKLENFIWKTARYVWCNHFRALVRRGAGELPETLPDGADFARDHADDDALRAELSRMRRKVADLSALQREAVILHYLDGLPVRDVALKLGVTESAVTWRLFDARKKVKKELEPMKDEYSYVYRPGRLEVHASGDVPQSPDTDRINDSLIRQNLCLLCRENGKTIDELCELTGVPKPYLEADLDWLAEREFLSLNGKRYQTAFLIMDQKYFEYRKELYSKAGKAMAGKIIDYLWSNENKIRALDFHGADFPAERLMWPVIMMFLSYASRNSELLLRLKNRGSCEIRTDGGKYYVMAVDRSDGHEIDTTGRYDGGGWEDFYGICSDSCNPEGTESYYWLGVYSFAGEAHRPEIVTGNPSTQLLLHRLYCDVLRPDFSAADLSPERREKLAEAVECGLIARDGDAYKPNFVIFTPRQLAKLRCGVFDPLLAMTEPDLDGLYRQFDRRHRADFPKAAQSDIDHHTYVDLWMFGVFALMFAAGDQKLCLPDAPEKGAPLTLVLIR